jgi:hypothetical protein
VAVTAASSSSSGWNIESWAGQCGFFFTRYDLICYVRTQREWSGQRRLSGEGDGDGDGDNEVIRRGYSDS